MNRITRRAALKGGIAFGIGLSFDELSSAQDERASMRPQEGDLLVKVSDSGLKPLTPADVRRDATQIMAWPMDPVDKTVRKGSRLNRVLLLRLDPEQLTAETRSRVADGVLAYTAICTHSGCDVEEWLKDEQLLYCSCHSSKFDPKDNAKVVDGPAPRMLPALPLKILDGNLVVAAPFTARVGFESF